MPYYAHTGHLEYHYFYYFVHNNTVLGTIGVETF